MLKVELNGVEFTVYTGLDLLAINISNKDRYFREIYTGLFISSNVTTDEVLKALGFLSGSYDWALPQEWARKNAVRSVDPHGEVYYANPRAVWCYQEDKGCNPVFGSPVWLSAQERELGVQIAEKIKEQLT